MDVKSRLKNKLIYIVFAVCAVLPLCLLFSKEIWFDEAYTLSLIQHDYGEIIDILKNDMHPPLYFLSLKLFCEIFGYTLISSKLFSYAGYLALFILLLTVAGKQFGKRCASICMIAVGAIPCTYLFSVQQRSYTWSIFFITLCYLAAVKYLEKGRTSSCCVLAISALMAGYNHIYALVTVAVCIAFLNIYILIKRKWLFFKLLVADLIMAIGYSFWLFILIKQTKKAAGHYWLKSIEPLSIVVFIISILLCGLILLFKVNRNITVVLGITTMLGVQAVGLGISVLIRPLYIGRYSMLALGVAAIIIGICVDKLSHLIKYICCAALCVINCVCFAFTTQLEYDSSYTDFIDNFKKELNTNDTLLYCDYSFGMLSYSLPEYKHTITIWQEWFSAFDNLQYIDKSQIEQCGNNSENIWFFKSTNTEMPQYIEDEFNYILEDEFHCDYEHIQLYRLTQKV